MYIPAQNLDDLLQKTLGRLLGTKRLVESSKGKNFELSGVLLKLNDPRARLSSTEAKGTVFSCLGELLWYLSGSNKLSFIAYYLPEYRKAAESDGTIWGAYGPRLNDMRGIDQLANVVARLKQKWDTRKAVIQLFNAEDLKQDYKDVPCTCTMQFMVREGKLELFVSMRSNDAFIGLPHDVFCFTMIQELIARVLNFEVGKYSHAVGSLHLYERNIAKAESYVNEGWQSSAFKMPPMPIGDPFPYMAVLLEIEEVLRNGGSVDVAALNLPDYWADLVRLLQIFALTKHASDRDPELVSRDIIAVEGQMSQAVYRQYIRKRKKVAKKGPRLPLLDNDVGADVADADEEHES